jgi:hypothetical protein
LKNPPKIFSNNFWKDKKGFYLCSPKTGKPKGEKNGSDFRDLKTEKVIIER